MTAAESSGVHPHTVASRKINVGLRETRRVERSRGPMLAYELDITDSYSLGEHRRTVLVHGMHIRKDGTTGRQSATAHFVLEGPGVQLDGPIPGWVAEVVDAAVRTVAEQSAGDR